MADKEKTRQQIAALVNKFRALPARERAHYNEQQTREKALQS
jgi:hypothetical protein